MVKGVTRTRLALNLALLALLLVLVVLAVFQPGTVTEPPKPKLSSIDPKSVTTITVTRPKQDTIVLRKEGTRWWLEQPLRTPANESRAQSLLGFVGDPSQESFAAKDHDLKRFGLAEPEVVLQVQDQRFAFGDTNPLSAQRYVLYGDRVHLVFESVYYDLQGDAAGFVSPRLIEEGREPVQIALPERTLRREGDRGWQLSKPEPGVTTDALTRLADEWRYVQAMTVRQLDRAKKPQGSVILSFKEGEALSYQVLAREPELILARTDLGLEYAVAAAAGKLLLEPQRDTKADGTAKAAAKSDDDAEKSQPP